MVSHKIPLEKQLRVCYEAGPTGYVLYWQLMQMVTHESAYTTGLYDRRDDEVSLDEIERIGI